MIGRWLSRLTYAQARWAKPFGDFNFRWLNAIFRPIRPVRDLLNGKWLGHSVHAALTDAPIGALTLAIVFDLIDLRTAADISLALGLLAMVGAALAGAADYSATDDDARMVATVHATLMVIAMGVYLVSQWLRWAGPAGADRTLPIVLSLLGYVIISGAAWVGGDVVYALGNMVYRHAWRFGAKPNWVKLDLAEIPENQPTSAKGGAQQLMVVRQGEAIYALHAQCAHAGGPLPAGRLVDGCIECPWHFSRFELATGHRRQGPTTFDQPRYEVRAADGGGWEVRRAA